MSPAALMLAVSAFLAALERSPRLCFRPLPPWRAHAATDVVYLVTGWLAGATAALAYVAVASDAVGRVLGVPRLAETAVPLWASVVVVVIGLDAGNYVAHWWLHRSAWLWEVHKIHHSSLELDWLATFRSHLLEQALRRVVAPLPVIAVGAPLDAVVVGAGVFTAWAVFNHSNLRCGGRAFETLLVTPRLHRAHHVPDTCDRNLGTILTVWDRLRGTLAPGVADPAAVFGVPGEVHAYPQRWLRQLGEPLRRIAPALRAPRLDRVASRWVQ